MKWASTLATGADFDEAFTGAIARLVGELDGDEPNLVMAFATPGYGEDHHRIPRSLRAAFPEATLAGCTAAGVVGGGHEVEEGAAISLVAAVLPDVEVRAVHIDGASLPGPQAESDAWHRLVDTEPVGDPQFILFADAFTTDIDALLTGLDESFPKSVVVGGLVSGASAPGLHMLFADDEIHRLGGIAIVLRGEVLVEPIVAQGCRPLGSPHVVTRCEVNLIHELDGEPAAQALFDLFNELSEEDQQRFRTGLVMGVSLHSDPADARPGDFLIRNVVGLDPGLGIVAVGSEMRTGQVIQFHVRDAQAAADDLRTMLTRDRDSDASPPAGALLFTCVGRGQGLYGEPHHDSGMMTKYLGKVPIGGFFCSGEIGPVRGATRVHGFTSSIALLRAP